MLGRRASYVYFSFSFETIANLQRDQGGTSNGPKFCEKQQKDSLINLKIQKENPKVVNEINIEDLGLTNAANCRCWRPKTFPACDGSRNKHNELTGDDVGPLILKKKEV
uniref:Iron-binding zinc finger CDGSH type domain-containing protein n=1 Tax=Oryctolagus cuniculus TaxID=9986 RepID=A0A5F9D764_RABIT